MSTASATSSPVTQDVLVGVVGPTTKPDSRARDLAFLTGRALAEAGAVIVTGGDHADSESKDTAKVAAILGALEAGESARVLGILSGGLTPQYDGESQVRYVATDMGRKRNILTGAVPDALIALPGGPGTLSEIAFALANTRPVIFLGWDRPLLENKLLQDGDEAATYVRSIPQLGLPKVPADNSASLILWLMAKEHKYAKTPADAVETAVRVPQKHAIDILNALARSERAWSDIGDKLQRALVDLRVPDGR